MERKELIAHQLGRLLEVNKAEQFLIYVHGKVCHLTKQKSYSTEKLARADVERYFKHLPVGYKDDLAQLYNEGIIKILPIPQEIPKKEEEE